MNNISKYLEEIKKYPRLSDTEVEEYFQKIRSGDQEARRRVAESHLVTVIELVSTEQLMSEMPFMDAVMEGNVALFQAIDEYTKNPSKWPDFESALKYHIEKSM